MDGAGGARRPLDLQTVRALLAGLGVSLDELRVDPAERSIPSLTAYIDAVSQAVSPGARRVYAPYWARARQAWGSRRLDEPTPLEIRELSEQVMVQAVVRRNSRGGRTAAEHMIAALRCLYKYAVADGLIAADANPAAKVDKPRRLASTRRALTNEQLAEIVAVAASTGNDPHLDGMLLRLHIETACRRGGALALRPADLDAEQCLVRLREKGQTVRWQPVSPTMIGALLRHGTEHDRPDAHRQLLRYRNGRPVTARRYDHLWHRIGVHLPWVATQQVTAHWIRHTTLTWVERNFGYAVARAFAGHSGRNDAGTTATYVNADIHEVATALAALTGEPHPLADPSTVTRRREPLV